LSAVADRFGFWSPEVSAWGNWGSFLEYTQSLNPLIPETLIPVVGIIATSAEIVFAVCLIIGFKTSFFAKTEWVVRGESLDRVKQALPFC